MNYNIDNINFDFTSLNDKDICVFQSLSSKDDIILCINKIFEQEEKKQINIHFNFKSLSRELRLEIFKFILTSTNIINFQILINIVNLLKNYNQFGDDFFSNDFVIINSLEEFLDFKIILKKYIDNYTLELSKWYISLFRSIHKIEVNYLDNVKPMPKSYQMIISNFDFYTLSGILGKSADFNISTCYLVEDAFLILSKLVEKQHITSSLFSIIAKHDSIK